MIGDYISDGFRRTLRFYEKVYTRRNRKTLKKDASTTIATNVTKDLETLDGEQLVNVVPNKNHLITNSGDVPEDGVELREAGRCSGRESIAEIRNVRSGLEDELDDVRRMVKKIEVNETSFYNGYNKCRLVLIPHPPRISCRYPQFTSYMTNRLFSPNYHPAICGIIKRERTFKGE
ncbi:hypothetical protein KY289_018180 [Solanum tuberosum]|nr:hypothetical protein KY289_018180 [Solanum tuberosum]